MYFFFSPTEIFLVEGLRTTRYAGYALFDLGYIGFWVQGSDCAPVYRVCVNHCELLQITTYCIQRLPNVVLCSFTVDDMSALLKIFAPDVWCWG